MHLRKHQFELQEMIDKIISGSSIKKIIIEATPGSGKSMLPMIAGKLITQGLADALCWIVPRKTLQLQGEQNFQDPRFREVLGHSLTIRTSTNDSEPCRGLDGMITTYQAIGVDNLSLVAADFLKKRYVLVLDESHHVGVGSLWHTALMPIVSRAKYLIMMTGTISRGDGDRIAFLPYDSAGEKACPQLDTDSSTGVVRYTRRDALAEKAILPLSFHLSSGNARWIDKDGALREADISKATRDIASQALFTAISTGFAETLLEAGVKHWQGARKINKGAKLLIVTASHKEAKRVSAKLDEKWLVHEIATSHESAEAHRAINRLRQGRTNILVTIAMAYEGLDCPEITHIVCLTNIRSTPWIEQMVARAVRVDPQAGPYETQTGFIFAPDDVYFREIVNKIESEQRPVVSLHKREQRSLFGESDAMFPPIQIQPLSSMMSGHREVFLGGRDTSVPPVIPQAPSENEATIRRGIEQHVRLYSFNNRYHNGQINLEIKKHFGKPRAAMTGDELSETFEWIKTEYPLACLGRGSGQQRVSTKAVRYPSMEAQL